MRFARAPCSSPDKNGSKRPVRPFSSLSRLTASRSFASSGLSGRFEARTPGLVLDLPVTTPPSYSERWRIHLLGTRVFRLTCCTRTRRPPSTIYRGHSGSSFAVRRLAARVVPTMRSCWARTDWSCSVRRVRLFQSTNTRLVPAFDGPHLRRSGRGASQASVGRGGRADRHRRLSGG